MDLSYGPRYEAFRQEVRAFALAHRDQAPKPGGPRQAVLDWQKILIAAGYTARTIPQAYGGFGAQPDILESRIIAEEFLAVGIPMGIANQGVSMLVPTLLELGTEEQRRQWIEPTIRGDIVWCQGYSEPGAGSDLAALTTRAVEDGDDFVINGQKIWTTSAHYSDMIFCLVRTEADAPKHGGISYLIFSMKTPGVEVRPLATMTGESSFNEVFFTDVRVPKTQIVGERGQGWAVANATLKHERGMLGDPDEAGTRFKRLVELVKTETVDGRALVESPVWRERLLRLQGRVLAMQHHGLRLLTASSKGEPPRLAGLVVKLQGCELNHELARYAIDALGELGLLYDGDPKVRHAGLWQRNYMFDLGLIIGGGTAQIQKNIIAERGLGLPREPRAAQ